MMNKLSKFLDRIVAGKVRYWIAQWIFYTIALFGASIVVATLFAVIYKYIQWGIMTTEQFAYWLQGFSEIHGAPPSAEQWEMIKEHLQTCFVKVTSDKYFKTDHWDKQISDKFPGLGTPVSPSTITC